MLRPADVSSLWGRGLALAAVLIFAFVSRPALAVGSKGEIWFGHYFSADDRELGAPEHAMFLVRWDVGVLAGEPVVVCRSAWMFKPVARAGGYDLPHAVLSELQLIIAEVELPVFVDGAGGNGRGWLRCDLGVMAKPFLGTKEQFLRLSKEEQRAHSSYNVPGSPEWDALFRDSRGRYLDEDAAKDIVKRGFTVANRGLQGQPRLFRHELGTLSVRMFLHEKEREALEAERERERERRRKERERRYGTASVGEASEGAGAKASDPESFWSGTPRPPSTERERAAAAQSFWQRPADERTVAEAHVDTAFAEREQALAARRVSLDAEARALAERLGARRREIENRPEPGGPKLPAFTTERRVHVPGWAYSRQVLGTAEKLTARTAETQFFFARAPAWAGDTRPYFLDLRTGQLRHFTHGLGIHGTETALASADRRTFAYGSYVVLPDQGRMEDRRHQHICALSADGSRYLDCQRSGPVVRDTATGAAISPEAALGSGFEKACGGGDYYAGHSNYAATVDMPSLDMFRLGNCLFDASSRRVLVTGPQGYSCGFVDDGEGVRGVCVERGTSENHGRPRGARLLEWDESFRLLSSRDLEGVIDPHASDTLLRVRKSRSGKQLLVSGPHSRWRVDPAKGQWHSLPSGGGVAAEAPAVDVLAIARERSVDVELYDVTSGQKLREVVGPSCQGGRFLGISPNGQHLTWLCGDGQLVVKEDRPPQ